MTTLPRPRFALELEALPDRPGDSPPSVRLRVLLKRLKRSYGFRCLRYAELGPGQGVAVLRAPKPPCTCGHPLDSHTADPEGSCREEGCGCGGWTPKEGVP
jgi:hypothetical protein